MLPVHYEYTDHPRNAYVGYDAGGTGYFGGSSRAVRPGYAHRGGGHVGPGTYVAPTTYGYGHRSMPTLDTRVRRGRDDDEEQTHALYESANTYEYMNNPGSKNERNRVPKTEKRPPGDHDVELIGGGGGNGSPAVVAAGSHKNRQRPNDERSRDFNSGKKKRKTTLTSGSNDGVGYSVSEPEVESSSSSKDNVRKGVAVATRPRKNKNGDSGTAWPNSDKSGKGASVDKTVVDMVDVIAGPVSKHKVHEKNEYSKKQQFFDEEHEKKPAEKVDSGGRKKVQKKERVPQPAQQRPKQMQEQRQYYLQPYGGAKRKRLVKKQTTAALLQQPSVVHVQDDRNRRIRPRSSTGYGQIIAFR